MQTSSSCRVGCWDCWAAVGAAAGAMGPPSCASGATCASAPSGLRPPAPAAAAGQDVYRSLPSKTLQLLRYALSSDCAFTHVVKADDDVHLRPQVG